MLSGFAIFIGDRKILEDQLDRFDRGFSGLLRGGAADICFDRMCQGIHAGRSGKLWRQTDGNFRFQNGVVRDQAEIVDRVFVMGIGIGDDGGKGLSRFRFRLWWERRSAGAACA